MAMYNSPSQHRASNVSRYRIVGFITVGIVILGSLWRYQGVVLDGSRRVTLGGHHSATNSLDGVPQTHKNVAVASQFGFHFDVYMALVWTIQRVMKDEGKVHVYRPPIPFYYDFQQIVDEYGLYNGTMKEDKELMDDIINGGDDGIDLVVLGTCEIDLRYMSEWLLEAWDARDVSHKFKVVCIVHDAGDQHWQASIPEWSRRNAIRLLPISQHVGRTFRAMFEDRARSSDSVLKSAGFEYIPIDAHVPILDVQNLPELPPNRVLSNAVIQGTFDGDRRDYARIFAELIDSLGTDPTSWGYLPLADRPSYIPDTGQEHPPFKLHLVGNGDLSIPTELENLVVFHTKLNYTEYYHLMGSMDACIPAFHSALDKNYKVQASSTIAMCMEVNVPILGLQQLREAYSHIDDERITITRPAVMSEIDALRALRTGDASSFLASDPSHSGITLGSHPRTREAVEGMMRRGWTRTKEEIEACKQNTWRANELVVMRILRDL